MYPRVEFDSARFTPAHYDGVACVVCDLDYVHSDAPSIPVAEFAGRQVFACASHIPAGAPASAPALDDQVRELLTVIREALDLPLAGTYEAARRRRELRGDNAVRVVFALEYILDGGLYGIPAAVRKLRKSVAAHPVDYAVSPAVFKVVARPREGGWYLHIPDVGVTQSDADPEHAEAMVRDFIALDLDRLPASFRIDLDTSEVDQ